MKLKRSLVAVSLAALVLILALISLRAYYVALALVVGALIMAHREVWSLITRRRLPPFDERVRENVSKSLRNGFIFFTGASAFLMLALSLRNTLTLDPVHLLGGLFLSAGLAYLLSYLYYDRSQPRLSQRRLRMMKVFLLTAGISLAAFILSAFLHNALSGLFGIEEPVFFFIAVCIAPLAFAVGLIGSLVIFIMGLLAR